MKKSFFGLFLLAFLAVVPLKGPYEFYRLAVSPTAVAEAYIINRNGKNLSYSYDFHVDGEKYFGRGSGHWKSHKGSVTYVVGNPEISRLTEEAAASILFDYLFLAVIIYGPCFYLLYGLRNSMKKEDAATLEVLRLGHCTQADILELKVHEGGQGVKRYAINYAYTPVGSSEQVLIEVSTYNPSGLGDEQKEDIAYLSGDPEHPVFLDALPGEVVFSESEGWVSQTPHLTLTALLLPVPALCVFFACLWYLVS